MTNDAIAAVSAADAKNPFGSFKYFSHWGEKYLKEQSIFPGWGK